MIQDADQFSGESGHAEQTLYDADLRPNTEHVLIQSNELTVDDPEFTAAIEDATARLSRAEDVTQRRVAADRRCAGLARTSARPWSTSRSPATRWRRQSGSIRPRRRSPQSQAEHPELRVEQFGNVSSNKELNDTFAVGPGEGRAAVAPDDAADPDRRLRSARGGARAAAARSHHGDSGPGRSSRIPSHLSPIDGNLQSVILLIGLAVSVDYSLFYLRREREERAAGRSERSALEVAAATSGRAVLISGLTVIAAMAGMFLTGDKTFLSFAQGTILVVAIAMVASLTVLPAVLAWLGDRVDKGRIPFLSRQRAAGGQVPLLVRARRPRDAASVARDR